jgi:hydrogenase expression/formation protein HypC
MCVAVPHRVIEINGHNGTLESMGVITKADISLIEDLKPGDYVLVHAGIAITKVDPEEAEETISIFKELAEVEHDQP